MKKKNLLLLTVAFLGLTTVAMAQVPNYVPTNGLVGWWPFTGNANDQSVNAITTTVAGAYLTSDRFSSNNNSYYFDGNDDTIYVNAQQNNITEYSISAWFKTTQGGVILSGRGANGQVGLTIRIMSLSLSGPNVGRAEFSTDQPGGLIGVMSNNTYSDNQWHNIVGVFASNTGPISPSHFTIYIDGNIVSTFNDVSQSANAPINNQTDMLIGNQIVWNGATFLGSLDDIGAWNRTLTECEITQLYTSGISPITTTTSASSICVGANTTITAIGANTYVWNPGNFTGSSITVSPTATTTYTVTGTDANGCVNTASTTVTVNPLPTVTANSSAGSVCAAESVTLTGGGASTYTWDNNVTDAVSFVPTATTQYMVTGTDSNGCVNTATTTVTVNPLPSVIATSTAAAVCAGSIVTLTGSGAATYTWDNNVTDAVSFVPTATTTYIVTGSDSLGCLNTASTTVTVNPLPILFVLASSQVYCSSDVAGALSANPTGGLWSGPGVTGNSFDPSVAGFGLHSIVYTYTDANSCSNSDSLIMTVNACVGINEITNVNLFSVYPNPAQSVINVKADATLLGSVYIVYDNTGKVVLSGKLNSEKTTLEIDNLSEGIYMFSIGENLNQTFKVIKE